MRRALPLVAPHVREHANCAYCPKLSHAACPVSEVQGRETTTPWAKMTSLHHVDEGNLPLERDHASSWWACTGCMRCREFCDFDNEVADALNAGRAEAARAGVAPQAAYDVIERHVERQYRARRSAEQTFGQALDGPADAVFVPGCTACALEPGQAHAGWQAVRTLLKRPVRVAAGRCCGLPLLEAGDQEGFLASARQFAGDLERARVVVFDDPGCLHALRVTAARLGEAPPKARLLHTSELAASSLARLGPVQVSNPVRWHDPCRLGRGLGVYEAPRQVIAATTGEPPAELPENRSRSECSGAGGQLPRTDPATAAGIASERMRAHGQAGGGTLVTGCPAAARALRRHQGPHSVHTLGSWIAHALNSPAGTTP